MSLVTNREYWLLLALLTNIFRSSESQDTCASQLLNQVVYDGQPADFSETFYSGCQWWYVPSSDDFNNIYPITDSDGNFISPYEQFYTVSTTTLRVSTATGKPIINGQPAGPDSTAGMYVWMCPDCSAAANLITVYNNGLTCTCDSIAEVVTCSITYAESTIQPSDPVMIWSDSSGKRHSPGQPTTVRNQNIYTSTLSLPISKAGASEYTCHVSFSAPDPFPLNFMTTNVPTFTTSCPIENCMKDETT